MDASIGSVFTVLTFVIFIAIVVWALSKRRKRAFDDAAREPFALPDETTIARNAHRHPAESKGNGASQ
ncbi:MAG TPA: CcoQ/FixQ family Cbb3-type cytochrome c oxidase assembly chaperone [Casimicrobiaceae bacterium]